ncbi:MAG: NADH-quinone oxidoreductase subunit J [Desulfobacterota bacterium]|nr:NADH-quinone oxidoreductase subunit J [Thermodesulfobacteriota bacterium]
MSEYRIIAEVVFYLLIVLTVAGAVLAVTARILIHAVVGLAVTFLGVAGFYVYLGSPFLSMMQILIYAGAITIVLVFGTMIGYTPRQIVETKIRDKNLRLALPACLVSGVVLCSAVVTAGLGTMRQSGDTGIADIGKRLLYEFSLAFELISLLLLIAMVGAMVIVGGQEERDAE